ncbi:thioesterase family protein [Micromonospora sp. NPDC049044]|uniref:thioesterase family protein n=1 Tax=unclassified Micromonospora TaxID=2617518 RepID=UPI00340B816C
MATTMPAARTEVFGRPRFEGSNICTWIGFKHVMYLIEEAVLGHLREVGSVPRQLYEEQGLGVEIVESDARIASALHMDDEVRTEVTAGAPEADGTLLLRTRSFVDRPKGTVRAVTATVRVAIREPGPAVALPPAPANLFGRGSLAPDPDVAKLIEGTNAVAWRWRIPYFYCHFSRHIQHSGYLRVMEEVVDLFLAERGISIRSYLDGRAWIPVVPRASVRILEDALMEEELHTVYSVEEIYKDFTYTSRMDCYVKRDGRLIPTATGRITHGYAKVLNRADWELVPFDARTLTALSGGAR